jgi:hypothetical protein
MEGDIIFGNRVGLSRVSALGGQPVPLEVRGVFPCLMGFISSIRPVRRLERTWVYLASLESSETRLLLTADRNTKAVYGNGHVLFVSGGVLMAHPFDVDRLELSGEASRIGTQVSSPGVYHGGDIPFRYRTRAARTRRPGMSISG